MTFKRGIWGMWLVVAGLLWLWSAASYAAVTQAGTLTVTLGQTRVVNAPNVSRVAVGNGALVQVQAFRDTEQVLLIGSQIGITDLRVWDFAGDQVVYQVEVVNRAPEISAEDLTTILQQTRGINIQPLDNGDILLLGNAERGEDFLLAESLAKRYPTVINQVTAPVVDLQATILIEAKVLEVRRSTMTEIGIDWEDTLNGPIFGLTAYESAVNVPIDTSTQRFFGISTQLDSIINILTQNGDGRLLAEPRLSVVSGGEASFVVGGEVPIPILDQDGSVNVTFKEYGIILRIQPVADPQGFINTQVGVEVSSIDRSVTVRDVPGFTTRRTETEMNVRDGQSLVISGLLSSEDSKSVSKVPGLGDIPIIGELFKSRDFQRDRTELVVVVTPHLVSPDSPRNQDELQRARQLENDSMETTRFSIFD